MTMSTWQSSSALSARDLELDCGLIDRYGWLLRWLCIESIDPSFGVMAGCFAGNLVELVQEQANMAATGQ